MCLAMQDRNPKPHGKRRFAKWMYEHFVSASEAARYSDVVSESTLRRWMKDGKTSFGMLLDVSIRNNHLVIPLYQAFLMNDELRRREVEKFAQEAFASEAEPKSGISRARPHRPTLKSSQPQSPRKDPI